MRVETYDDAIFQLNAARNDAAQKARRWRRCRRTTRLGADVMRLNAEMALVARDAQARDAKLAELTVARASDQEARRRPHGPQQRALAAPRAWATASKPSRAKGALAKALADTKLRLDELRKQQAAAEARAAQFRELAAPESSSTPASSRS